MNYKEAIDYIHGTYKFGIKLGLENIKKLLDVLGNPQDSLKFIHIAGTNGKGSTAAFIYNVLREAGYSTGFFISPFITRFNERIQINGKDISDNDLADITSVIKAAVDKMVNEGFSHPTEFEIVTAISMLYFNIMKCDIVVLEVGLGGRYDSTNIIKKPEIGIITKISLDHIEILGDTIEKIAYEKGGIIKDNSDIIIYPQEENVMKVLTDIAYKKNAKVESFRIDEVQILESNISKQIFNYNSYNNIEISLNGIYQVYNAVTAIKCIVALTKKGFSISDSDIKKGLLKTKWPCRLEIIKEKPLIIIDGSHNVDGVSTLTDFIKKEYPNKKIIFVFGMMGDKDYKNVIKMISQLAKGFILVDIPGERSLKINKAAEIIESYCKNILFSGTIEETSDFILSLNEDDVVFAVGSFYYLGELKSALLK